MPTGPADAPAHATRLHNKIFGVGLARTGTTSLHEAMLLLGHVSAPDSLPLLDGIDLDFLRAHDAFFDNPIPFRYQALDTVCPNSKWIVTQRPVDDWLASIEWLYGPGIARLSPSVREIGDRVHRQLYGSDRFDETRLRAIYERHYGDLAEWVQGRRHAWIHVEQGLGWAPICDLLDVAVPDFDFPHVNRRKNYGLGRLRSRRDR